MTFSELLDNWIGEKIIRAQTDLIARTSKLEMRVVELERLVVQRENDDERSLADRVQYLEQEQMSEYRVQEIIQTRLCNTDWSDMIGEEVGEIVDDKLKDMDLDEASIRDFVRDEINDTQFEVTVNKKW